MVWIFSGRQVKSPPGQFEVWFAQLEDFKRTHGTITFLVEDKQEYPKLPSWSFYSKCTAIKVFKMEVLIFFKTLVRIKKLVDIDIAP
jgi:hypothetical protein